MKKGLLTTIETILVNFMQLNRSGQFTKYSKIVSQFERNVQIILCNKNAETKTTRGKKSETLQNVEIIYLI